MVGWTLACVLHVTAGVLILRALPVGDPIAARPSPGRDIIMRVSLVQAAASASFAAGPAANAPGAPASLEPVAPAPEAHGRGGQAAPVQASIPTMSAAVPVSTIAADTAAPSLLQGAAADQFRDLLTAHIARFVQRPTQAAAGGTVWLRFVMDRAGHVQSVWVDQSSGRPDLDAEALSAVRRAVPLPAIPPSLPDRLDMTLPVGFSLG
jgi:protein TonB